MLGLVFSVLTQEIVLGKRLRNDVKPQLNQSMLICCGLVVHVVVNRAYVLLHNIVVASVRCTTNPQQIEVMEFGPTVLLSGHLCC